MFFANSFSHRGLQSSLVGAWFVRTCIAVNSLIVGTTVGTVYGLINGTTPNVAQFLGIPYAEPPVGPRRWLPAVSKAPVGIIDATSISPACPQFESTITSVYNVDARNFLISGPTSEDCLTLNIWAPVTSASNCSEKLPVLVWIYGGGFQTGGGRIGYQIPSQWVQRSQQHIVVGINYRLNIFGFPNAVGLNSSDLNLGFLDQRLGLEWVRSNIASFGGDPSRITLWGQSAGAISVDSYNFAYPTDPIIAGLIMDSGTALLPLGTTDPTHSNFTFVASQFGCGNQTASRELDCMRNVSSANIELFLKSYSDNGTQPSISFNPVVDNRTKFTNYTARALAKNFTLVPAIIGTNTNEGVSLVDWNPNGANQTNADLTTLGAFLCPAVQTTTNRLAVNATTYRYLYAGNFSNLAPRPWEGAYHSSELPLIFGTTNINSTRESSTDFELALSRQMQDLWLAFISDPVNGLQGTGWEEYSTSGQAVEFGKGGVLVGRIGSETLEGRCNGQYPKVGTSPPM
ncbi:Alpha/Beta hydrolase protein [Tricladium varicosporioides]|nr:Alpha/Beta hydrolase protein [Hymenoscyphus varicosporioides]